VRYISFTANFQLPEEGVLFDKVEFIELPRDEAQPLVEKYNKEGKAAQPPDSKRFRGSDRDRYSSGSRFSTLLLWICFGSVLCVEWNAMPLLPYTTLLCGLSAILWFVLCFLYSLVVVWLSLLVQSAVLEDLVNT